MSPGIASLLHCALPRHPHPQELEAKVCDEALLNATITAGADGFPTNRLLSNPGFLDAVESMWNAMRFPLVRLCSFLWLGGVQRTHFCQLAVCIMVVLEWLVLAELSRQLKALRRLSTIERSSHQLKAAQSLLTPKEVVAGRSFVRNVLVLVVLGCLMCSSQATLQAPAPAPTPSQSAGEMGSLVGNNSPASPPPPPLPVGHSNNVHRDQASATLAASLKVQQTPVAALRRHLDSMVGTVADLLSHLSVQTAEIVLMGGTYGLAGTQLEISHDVIIRAAPGATVVLDGEGLSRVLYITGGVVTLSGLSITGGDSAVPLNAVSGPFLGLSSDAPGGRNFPELTKRNRVPCLAGGWRLHHGRVYICQCCWLQHLQ